MPQTILITGGTGLIGSHLTEALQKRGDRVIHLSRTENLNADVSAYGWDWQTGQLNAEAVKEADAVIHLAGASVADGRWTPKRRRLIRESRVQGTELLAKTLVDVPNRVKAVVCASAVGWYGSKDKKVFDETDAAGKDFLAKVTRQWEEAQDKLREGGRRVTALRIGFVLAPNGGGLDRMVPLFKKGLGAPLGSGEQPMPWIHIDDIVGMFLYALDNEAMSGTYNATSSGWVSNKIFTRELAGALGKKALGIHVPAFVLYLAMGSMAKIALRGVRASPMKIQRAGYQFVYQDLKKALAALFPAKS